MPLPVKLADVVENLTLVGDDVAVHLNKKTGEFVVLTSDDYLGFEDEDDFALVDSGEEPDWLEEQEQWLQDEWRLRRDILNSADYVSLPDKFELHEWQIMDDFCRSLRNARVGDELASLIRGRGAFGRFHSAIIRFGIENHWYEFKDTALSEIAVRWLEENEIEFVPIVNSVGANTQLETDVSRGQSAGYQPGVQGRLDLPQRAPQISLETSNVRDKRASVESVSADSHQRWPKRSPQTSSPTSPHTSNTTTQVAAPEGEKSTAEEIKVFISNRDSHCGECDQDLGKKAWITLEREKGALCLACADLDELVFLPAGDAALTRRSKKYSTLSAVVLKFSKTRGRYERQGLLVEEAALEKAETECLADSEARERRNERARERRAELDEEYVREFAKHIRMLFPNCPQGREQIIAQHACLKYSERVGRAAAAKRFEEEMITLAVAAHVRHRETNYDSLLAKGWFRNQARAQVSGRVEDVLENWRG